MKKYAEFILLFIVAIYLLAFIAGCQRKLKPLLIETNYVRAGVGGALTPTQVELYKYTLDKVLAQPYRERQWSQPFGASVSHGVSISDIDSKSASITVSPGSVMP